MNNWSFLVRYWWADCKALYGELKLFGCSILYLLLRDLHPEGYDVRLSFLLYSLALFGVLYFCVLTGLLIAMSGVLCLAAFGLFYGGYRRYERRL